MLRKKFGMMSATSSASYWAETPKYAASTASRANPRTADVAKRIETTTPARVAL
jgi:hypothetical protein